MTREISCKVEPYSNVDCEASLAATGEPTVVKKDPLWGVCDLLAIRSHIGVLEIFWLLAPALDVLCRRFIVILASFGGSRRSRSFTAARPWPAPEHQAAPAGTCSAGVVGTDVLGVHASECDEFPRGSVCPVGRGGGG